MAGPLALRSGDLSENLKEIIQGFCTNLEESQWSQLLNSFWALWRCRNDKAYSGIDPTFAQFSQYLNTISQEAMIASAAAKVFHKSNQGGQPAQMVDVHTRYKAFVDGSWTMDWGGGIGFVIFDNDVLTVYVSAYTRACCPILAEARALLEAVKYVVSMGIEECTFYSDCQSLVQWCLDIGPPTQADWKIYRECLEIWRILKANGNYYCRFVPRCQNDMADQLARRGRMEGGTHRGYTFPTFRLSSFLFSKDLDFSHDECNSEVFYKCYLQHTRM